MFTVDPKMPVVECIDQPEALFLTCTRDSPDLKRTVQSNNIKLALMTVISHGRHECGIAVMWSSSHVCVCL